MEMRRMSLDQKILEMRRRTFEGLEKIEIYFTKNREGEFEYLHTIPNNFHETLEFKFFMEGAETVTIERPPLGGEKQIEYYKFSRKKDSLEAGLQDGYTRNLEYVRFH